MVWAGESSSPGQGRNNNGLEIGCLVDTTNGLLTFTANGKELSTYYKVNLTTCYMLLNVLVFFSTSLLPLPLRLFHHTPLGSDNDTTIISQTFTRCVPPTGRAQY